MSFPVPLAHALDEEHVHYIAEGEEPPAGCRGSVEKPEAESGNLCVFTQHILGLKVLAPVKIALNVDNAEDAGAGAGMSGAYLLAFTPAATETIVGDGDWVVTG